MKADFERYFYEKGYDECTKRVFEIICSPEVFNITSIDEIDDLNDYINLDEYMNRAASLIHSGFSSEWTSNLAHDDEYERDQIAVAFAEIIASNNAINEDEEEYYSIYARLFKEAHNSDSEVLMNTLTNNSIEEYALNHNEYYYSTYR